jgi:hypothetical protein
MAFDYVAVPWAPDAVDPQPEMRAALEAEGFRLLGGCALTEAGIRAAAAVAPSYGPDHAEEFARWGAEPGQVLAAPDRAAFVLLAWLWDCRYATFTTVLDDGTVLQTMTEWGADPVWPTALAGQYDASDRHTEQLVLATDPDARVVEGGVEQAWRVHGERLSPHAGSVPDHVALEDFVAIWAAESQARGTWSRRVQLVAGLMTFLVVLVPFLVMSLLLPQSWWVQAGLVAAAGLVFLASFRRTWLRVRRWRGLRPSFRAPVPGTR